MTHRHTMLASLAFGASIVLAGPAFADKMKATLDGASEVPPTTSAGKGTADIDFDPATKKLTPLLLLPFSHFLRFLLW